MLDKDDPLINKGFQEITQDLPFGLIGHYKSVVNAITKEFLCAMDHYIPHGYEFDEKTSWHICRLQMKENFMTIQQMNFFYHQTELSKIRKNECPKCMYQESTCPQEPQDLERCWRIAEIKKYDDWYAAAIGNDW